MVRPARPPVGAAEVASKRLLELWPGVDGPRLEAVEPHPRGPLQHERDVANRHALVAAGDVDGHGVVDQPILGVGFAVVLGGVAR